MNNKIKFIDLFAGCGGLTDGFMQTGFFQDIAAVEWKLPQVLTLRHRLVNKWNNIEANESVLYFDIQREEELFIGWNNDPKYVSGKGLDYYVNKNNGIDVIIGGPPCQAYSVAGRVRDENGMHDDYRNYLFEHYLSIVDRYQPDIFIFENVPGILSACPNGVKVSEVIPREFAKKGYSITRNLSQALVNASDYNVPQNRKRIIMVGVREMSFKHTDIPNMLDDFYYNILPSHKGNKVITVKDAIGSMPPLEPYWDEAHHSKRVSHSTPTCDATWHEPRYNNARDMKTFRLLAKDVESGSPIYNSKKIAELYEEKVGSKSPIHRYHVLNPNLPSTTIIAHLYKDGNRFIHYDSKQARTITPREAGLLQSFDIDFEFIGSRGSVYEMIGNAVPPQLAKALALAVVDLLKKYKPDKYV
ncbi:MAG: DNA cytosine methyltransferase [Paludibacteraceae bacterium]|nr:DNA cytosine methyltransferase [Paludibacteraceae bacterium]